MKNEVISKMKSLWNTLLYLHFRRLYNKEPRQAADALFKRVYGRKMDLKNPKHLIEKITWLQFNTDTSLWTLCADKFRVREYVSQCGLSNYLPKLYGHWDSPDDIDFAILPNQFVLKANNGCGTVRIVKDKSQLDIKALKKVLRKWLRHPYGYMGAQAHYLKIKPCILAEELLPITGEQAMLSPNSLMDYKIWCFNGKPENCLIVFNRDDHGGMNIDLYDTQWNRLGDCIVNNNPHYHLSKDTMVPKPASWDEMLRIASILSKPFPEVRVDVYEINGKPYIGELTFTSGYGYFTEEYYDYLGNKIDIEAILKSS